MTVTDLKQQFVDHLGSMDKEKMNMVDLNVYVNILKMVSDMDKPDQTSMLMDICKRMYKDPETMSPVAVTPDFSKKEDANNG